MTPATDWKERVLPDEQPRFEAYARTLRALQDANVVGGTKQRALHAKPHLGLEASFTVHEGLPDFARVGAFATAQTYRAYVRFSNGDPAHRADRKDDVRGLALKLVGVEGKKLIPGMEDAKTHDLLFIQPPSFAFRGADDFMKFVRAMSAGALAPLKLVAAFGLGGTARLVKALKASVGVRVPSLATLRFYTAAPSRFGVYAVKYDLVPTASRVEGPTAMSLHEELGARLAQGPVSYTLRAQFFVDEAQTPIEDPTVAWPEAVAPFVPLGTLTLAQQDVRGARAKAVGAFVERLSFDPWHAPVEFRPLGEIMRARNVAYRESTLARGAAAEPDGTETFG